MDLTGLICKSASDGRPLPLESAACGRRIRGIHIPERALAVIQEHVIIKRGAVGIGPIVGRGKESIGVRRPCLNSAKNIMSCVAATQRSVCRSYAAQLFVIASIITAAHTYGALAVAYYWPGTYGAYLCSTPKKICVNPCNLCGARAVQPNSYR